MKKVLVLTNIFPRPASPNTGFYIFEQVKRLKEHFDIQVLIATPESIFQGHGCRKIDEKVRYRDFDIHQASYCTIPKLGVFFSGYFYYWSVLKLVENIRKDFPFDLVVSYWTYPEGFAAVKLGKKFDVPVVIRPRGSDINVCLENSILKRIVRSTLNQAARVIPVSEMLMKKIKGIGITHNRYSVISNGVNAGEFFPMNQSECRTKLNIPANKKMVLYVGNLIEIKGIEYLLKAIKILDQKEKSKELLFCILGSGKLEDQVKIAMSSLKNASIRLAGDIPHEELRRWINASDVLCLPSLDEGCPNVVLEALACGVPVVASKVGGVPELINAGHLGILVPPKSAVELGEGLEEALKKEWNKESLAVRVKDETWEKAAERLSGECTAVLLTFSQRKD